MHHGDCAAEWPSRLDQGSSEEVTPPKVSVILPVRNGAPTIERAVRSVLNQSLQDLELLVIDDHSTDATLDILHEVADPRMRILAASGQGLVNALNQGLTCARSTVAARVDADDWMEVDRLRAQLSLLDEHPDTSVVVTSSNFWDEASGTHLGVLKCFVSDEAIRLMLLRGTGFTHSSVAYRINDVLDVGGYRTASYPAEDYDLWLRLAMRGKRFRGIAQALTNYSLNPESISSRHGSTQKRISRQLRGIAVRSSISKLARSSTMDNELVVNQLAYDSVGMARLQAACFRVAAYRLLHFVDLINFREAVAAALFSPKAWMKAFGFRFRSEVRRRAWKRRWAGTEV